MIWSYQDFSWDDLTPANKTLFENIELDMMSLRRNIKQLNEYIELSDNTIGQIFTNAEQLSKSKKLRTSFGKSIHLPRESMIQVNKVLGNFGRRLQESTPVKAFDQKFEDAKNKVKDILVQTKGGRNALAYIDILGNAAREHPIWQAATIGLLVGISTFVAGPVGALIAGPVLKGAVELVKGERLSTAVGKGIYAGALGFLTANIATAFTHWAEGVRIAHITHIGPENLGIEQVSFSGGVVQPEHGFNWTKVFRFSNITVDPSLKSEINNAIIRLGGGDFSAYDELLKLGKKAVSPDYLSSLADKVSSANTDQIANDAFLNSVKRLGRFITAAAAGTAVAANDLNDKTQNQIQPRTKAPIVPGSTPTGKEMPTDASQQIWQWIQQTQQKVDDGTLALDQLRGLYRKCKAARDKIQSKPNMTQQHRDLLQGFNGLIDSIRTELSENKIPKKIMEGLWADLTLQFGAGKLKQAWEASGRPTDSTDIARMLVDMGMSVDDVRDVMINSGISEDDVNETIKELHNSSDESEFEVPFTSGIAKWDNEAKQILKTKGKDAFIAYWEGKVIKIEKAIDARTPKPEPEALEPVAATPEPEIATPTSEPKVEEPAVDDTSGKDAADLLNKLDKEEIETKAKAPPVKKPSTRASATKPSVIRKKKTK